ncbi:MAG: hypothetical protein WC711_03695 [Candidatus Staskawiczbacteria bacterium]
MNKKPLSWRGICYFSFGLLFMSIAIVIISILPTTLNPPIWENGSFIVGGVGLVLSFILWIISENKFEKQQFPK